MKKWKYVTPLLVFALIAVITCSKKEEEAGTSWTIIGYFDGNNNLDISQNNTSFTIEDVHEFEDVGSTDRVKVVVALGSLKTGGIVKYYLVEKHENELPDSISSPVLQNLGTKDMSDPQTLRSFIEYAVSNYPADHYMLIVDDHGGGWRGVCVDEQNGAGDMMTLPELRGAIPDNVHFDIIVFHACLMSMAEVAYELKDKADYMVASEFTLPMQSVLGPGEWYLALTQNPDMSADELARKIVEAVYHAGENKGKTVHMAAIDLSKMTALGSKVADFGNALVTESGDYWDEVLDAWNNTHYTQYDDPAFVDLREFAKIVKQEPHIGNIPLIKNAADSLVSCINSAVLMTMTNAAGITRGGLTIHFPSSEDQFDSTNYVKLAFKSTNWYSFLSKFIHSTGGGGGGETVTISGTVSWPGHNLTANCVAFLDTSHTSAIVGILPTQVDPQTGQYTIQFQLQGVLEAYIEAWDDVNGNGQMDAGDGLGFYDANGNGQWDDMLQIQPGQTISNADITLFMLSGEEAEKLKAPKR